MVKIYSKLISGFSSTINDSYQASLLNTWTKIQDDFHLDSRLLLLLLFGRDLRLKPIWALERDQASWWARVFGCHFKRMLAHLSLMVACKWAKMLLLLSRLYVKRMQLAQHKCKLAVKSIAICNASTKTRNLKQLKQHKDFKIFNSILSLKFRAFSIRIELLKYNWIEIIEVS